MEHTKTKGCLDSLTLKLLAMALMLCDHLWATVLPGVMWLTAVGRIAFPIFAFQVAEGFQRTHDRKKYLLRMRKSVCFSMSSLFDLFLRIYEKTMNFKLFQVIKNIVFL